MLRNVTPPGRSTAACMGRAPSLSPTSLWKAARSTTTTTIPRLTSGTREVPWIPSTSGHPSQLTASWPRSPKMFRTQMVPWSSTPCSSSVSLSCVSLAERLAFSFCLCSLCRFKSEFSHFLHSSLGWEIPWKNGGQAWFPGHPIPHNRSFHDASHRWGSPPSLLLILKKPDRVSNCQSAFAGLYDFYEDTENKLFVLNMPLGKKQASMILIMPYHLEPLARLEKLLTRKQVDTWMSKMENKAVAISMPKISVDVSHNLQVNGGGFTDEWSKQRSLKIRRSTTSCVTWATVLHSFRNTWRNLAWPRLSTRPRPTCPTSLERRTCTSPTSSMLQPWSWTWRETPSTPASSELKSWGTPSSSTSIIPSFSWWRTTRPTVSCTSAEWCDPRETRCVTSCNVMLSSASFVKW